ncbi:MAG: glycoside hydrolase family 3 C-terminal domain-containing protein, partial [Blautia sp.]|nr:glycoside hydrolase family 3 C-terminal domain-containing protein [Blautia sp.]
MSDENKTEVKTESKKGFYGSYSEFFRQMADKFGDLPQDNIRAAYDRSISFSKGFTLNQDMIDLYTRRSDKEQYKDTVARRNGHSVMPSFGTMYENPAIYTVGEDTKDIYDDAILKSADDTVAVVVISRDSSEAADYNPDMKSGDAKDNFERPLALSDNEKDMLALAKEHSTKVVVLLNTSSTIEVEELKNDDGIDAILWTGQPGVNGFLGIADVLSGEVNPSGKIADTYAVNSASSPAMVNMGVYLYTNNSKDGSGDQLAEENKGDWYIVESEGIYVGYKYYETRYEDAIAGKGNASAAEGASNGASEWKYENEVSYPFGYGLSYTTFEQKLDSVEVEVGGKGSVKATVTNTGDVAGKDVVELYVQTPYTEGGLEKSAIQLVGYAKTAILEPGASEEVTIEFDPAYIASYDETAEKADGTVGAWVLEAGDYYFAIGNGAHEALNNVLASKNGGDQDLVTITENEVIEADRAVVWNLAQTDLETYSVNVQNQLQDMDINKLIENTVEYTTRSDWTKGWTPVEAITPSEAMMVGLRNQNYELNENGSGVTWGQDSGMKLVDMMTFDENGNYAGVLSFDDPMWDQLLDQITLDEAIQFIEKGGDDIENVDSVGLPRTYANDGPVGFANDQVGGYFVRWSADLSGEATYTKEEDECAKYSMATMPTEPVVAASMNKELVIREGELFAEDGLWSNESSIFAPGSNLHRTPYCARNHEYYSEDSMLTALMSNDLCIGGKSRGIMMEAKHFAFNHQESNRSGLSTFVQEQAARENELRGFQLMMSENNTMGVMTAFNRAGTVYVGAFKPLLVNIARDEWGYMGWFNTDMINGADYMNWRDITAAGGGNCLTT